MDGEYHPLFVKVGDKVSLELYKSKISRNLCQHISLFIALSDNGISVAFTIEKKYYLVVRYVNSSKKFSPIFPIFSQYTWSETAIP